MRRLPFAALLLVAACARSATDIGGPARIDHVTPMSAPAQAVVPANNPMVGGTILPVDRSIADDLAAAPGLTDFVRLVEAAGMTDTLRAPGPFTVFAPTMAAFDRLQPGTVDTLLKPENRTALTRLVGLHIVAERLSGVELLQRIAAGGGRARLSSVAGEPLIVTMTAGIVTLTDAGGDTSYIETADVRAANGVIHVVNGVLVPRLN